MSGTRVATALEQLDLLQRDARLERLSIEVANAMLDERGILTDAECDLLARASLLLCRIPDLDR